MKNKDQKGKKLKIIYHNIKDLKRSEYNPRKITDKDQTQIKKSLTKYGFVEPIVINRHPDRNMVVIGGHQRLHIAEEMGYKVIPCQEENLKLKDEKELNIRLNQNQGEWDFGKLEEKFDFDSLLNWGFDNKELPFTNEEIQEDNFDSPIPQNPVTKTGDIYELNKHRLMCGDSTKKDDVEKLMKGNNPYLMVTDPPYGINYNPVWRSKAMPQKNDAIHGRSIGKVNNDDNADWTKSWALSYSKVVYVYHAGKFTSIVQQSLENCNYEIRSQIVWVKSHFAISRSDYHGKHEPCWYAVKKGFKANWIGDKKQSTIWDINKSQKNETGHSTQKPIECMARPIRNHQGNVYDPFIGSGSTLIACEQLNRKCYGMEIDPKYCDVIVKRFITYMRLNNKPFDVIKNGQKLPNKQFANDFFKEEKL